MRIRTDVGPSCAVRCGSARERYDLDFRCHLAPSPDDPFQGDAQRYPNWALDDAKREAEALGERIGRAVDPFGEPVKRAYSLFPWAREQGRAAEYLQTYLDAAFADGINITSDTGLRQVVERAGLDWGEAEPRLGRDGWQEELDRNLEDLHEAGLWGVPSFRISGGNRPGSFSCWGQDRPWRVAAEIADHAPQR